MKTIVMQLLTILALAIPALAANEHKHEKKEAGPNGGRVITSVEPHIEFFVTADRKVQLTFLGEDNKVIAPAEQSVTIICGDRSNPTRLTFTKSDNFLISDQILPEGNDFPTVVQIKPTPNAKAIIEKFNLNLSICPECKLAEYACICDHS